MKENIIKTLCVSGMVASLALFSAGCTKDSVPSDAGNTSPGSQQTSNASDDDPGKVTDISDTGNGNGSSRFVIAEGRTHEGMQPVYFDFDKSDIRDDQKGRIEVNAEFLKANPQHTITIEGNTDDRGTTEYNVALGVRRAKVAKKYMMNLGVSGNRISTQSWGEENPLLLGQNEDAWSQNRRDDFVIQ